MWHFSDVDKRLRFGDDRSIVVGETLTVNGPIELCKNGLHASHRLIDALAHAPGPYVWKVKLSGIVIHGDDKSVATERTALWGFDATDVLHKFSRKVALKAVNYHWQEAKVGAFPEVVLKWLKTGDDAIRSAARSAAWSAARSAARWAARSAELAARSAARSADWSAAESAAWWAAWSADWSAQNKVLSRMISEAAKKQSGI